MNQTTQDAPEANDPSETKNPPEVSDPPAARVHPRFTKPQRVAFVHRQIGQSVQRRRVDRQQTQRRLEGLRCGRGHAVQRHAMRGAEQYDALDALRMLRAE